AGDSVRGLAYLDTAPNEGADGAGLRYLTARAIGDLQAEKAVLFHGDLVDRIVIRRDGSRAYTTSRDGTMAVWDVASGRARARVPAQRGGSGVYALAPSPDESRLARGADDAPARLFATDTGAALHVLQHGGWVLAVAFRGDGRLLATASLD